MPEEEKSNWYYARNVVIGYALILFWAFFPGIVDEAFQMESVFLSTVAMLVGGIPIVWFINKYATGVRETNRNWLKQPALICFFATLLIASAVADFVFESMIEKMSFLVVAITIAFSIPNSWWDALWKFMGYESKPEFPADPNNPKDF